MAHIIQMNSKEFVNKFIDNYNPKDFTIMIVSDDIGKKRKSKYKNVFKLSSMMPPPNIFGEFMAKDNKKKYFKKYKKFLYLKEQVKVLAIIAKAAAVDNENVIILASKDECRTDANYLDVFCEVLEELFKVKTCTYKEFHKNPDKYDNSDKAKKVGKIFTSITGVKIKKKKKSDK